MRPILYLIPLSLLFASCVSNEEKAPAGPPNIVFIMSDDHAYQAISAYGSGLIETPNIDQLAEQGMKFDRCFVTNSICAPSRAVILTGKFSHLNGITGNEGAFDGSQETFPKLLQKNGYQTALVGKWHLRSTPTGFDHWNILPGQGDYYNPEFIDNGERGRREGYVTELITDLSLNWLDSMDKSRPFCLMMQHKAPHRNWMPALEKLGLFNDAALPLPGNFYEDYNDKEALQQQLLTVRDHMDLRLDLKVPCDTCPPAPVNAWAPAAY